jgi:hypothetical protein
MSNPRVLLALPAFRQSKDLTDHSMYDIFSSNAIIFMSFPVWENMWSELDEYFEGLKAIRLQDEYLQMVRKCMGILVDVVWKYTLT